MLSYLKQDEHESKTQEDSPLSLQYSYIIPETTLTAYQCLLSLQNFDMASAITE